MAMIEDLDVFFDTDDFAVLATVAGGGSMPVIFDRAHIEALGGGEGVSATEPIALARQTDLDLLAVVAQAEISMEGAAYIVRDLQPDGTGLVLLILEAQ